MNLAPIVVFCYNRPDHLKQTIDALLENKLAKTSDLILFSDGPKNEAVAQQVKNVRSYIGTITGFKSVKVHESPKNKGLAQSIISGVSLVVNEYGKAIVMEDDLLSTSDFLQYMNEALEAYSANPIVFSVSGYSFGIDAVSDYEQDTALIQRASSLGWGTWKHEWERVDWNVSDFPEFLKDKSRQNKLKNAGEDVLPMIIKQQRGLINSWAVRWAYHHVKSNGYCLVPFHSKIKTIGDDGSGSNPVARSLKADKDLVTNAVKFNSEIRPDARITRFIRLNNRPSLYRRIINLWKFGVW